MYRFCFVSFTLLVMATCSHYSLVAAVTPLPCNPAEDNYCNSKMRDVTRDNLVTQLFYAADNDSVLVDFNENIRRTILQFTLLFLCCYCSINASELFSRRIAAFKIPGQVIVILVMMPCTTQPKSVAGHQEFEISPFNITHNETKLDSAAAACPSRVTHPCARYTTGILIARACDRFRSVLTSDKYTISDLKQLLDCNPNTGFIGKFFNETSTIGNEIDNLWINNTHRAEEFLQENECKIDKQFAAAVSAESIGAACGVAVQTTFSNVVSILREAYNCRANGSRTTATPQLSTITQSWWNQTTTQRPWGLTTTDWRATTSNWNWWNQTTTQRPWGLTTTDWRATTSNWNWWNQTTTRSVWQSTTTRNWWSPTTTPRPAVEIPAYLLTPFKVTCRRGSFNLSEEDPDLVDALTMVFDGDNTFDCRLILSDLHSWILAKTGNTRQKRASDYEPVKVECARGNLTISSVDPGTSESTDLVFRTGGSKNCITIYREFLTYIAYAFKSHSGI